MRSQKIIDSIFNLIILKSIAGRQETDDRIKYLEEFLIFRSEFEEVKFEDGESGRQTRAI